MPASWLASNPRPTFATQLGSPRPTATIPRPSPLCRTNSANSSLRRNSAYPGMLTGIRRPLPLRFREVASLLGLVIIVVLMGLALKNDVEKRWDIIVAQVEELVG